jgi:hypothetical protein
VKSAFTNNDGLFSTCMEPDITTVVPLYVTVAPTVAASEVIACESSAASWTVPVGDSGFGPLAEL